MPNELENQTSETLFHFNGINGSLGTYGLAPMTGKDLSDYITGAGGREGIGERAPDDLAELKARHDRESEEVLGVREGVDPTRLEEAGWAVILPAAKAGSAREKAVAAVKEALSNLLALRQEQAGERYGFYNERRREREDSMYYRPGEMARQFLARHGVRPSDPADPERVPYYLLIVGSPEEIPFQFQYQLDVQYAVGRIDFGDSLDAYANYARSVVASTQHDLVLKRRASFFGVDNPNDEATKLSAEHLVRPLHENLSVRHPSWDIDRIPPQDATKAQLLHLLSESPPAFLFTASHGVEFSMDDPHKRQIRHQGALLCGEWPGPENWRGSIPQDYYLAGDDLTSDVNLLGTVAFLYACYGAGTPLYDAFTKQAFKKRAEMITYHPFTAALPKAMLSLSKGGALAVVAHVERAWGSSYLGPGGSEQTAVFEDAIERLLKGHPVGSAMEYFDERYAAVATELTDLLGQIEDGGYRYDPYELARLWTENNDARGYVIVGDPAVSLPVAPTDGADTTGRRQLEGRPVKVSNLYVHRQPEEALETPPAGAPFTNEDWFRTPLSVREYIETASHQRLSEERAATAITAHLETQISAGENLVYCASFQIAWDQLSDEVLQEPLQLDQDPWQGQVPWIAQVLNKRLVGKHDIAEDCYLAMAGRGHEGIVERIQQAMQEKFNRTPELDITLDDPNGILAYAFLQKSLPFDTWFEVFDDPLKFSDGVEVQSFGIEEDDAAADQVVVLDYRDPDDFIIKLQGSEKVDEMMEWGAVVERPRITDDIILAKIAPRATLLDTVHTVLMRTSEQARKRARIAAALAGRPAHELLSPKLDPAKQEVLQIPKIQVSVLHRYSELIRRNWLNEGFEGYHIAEALQVIEFKLDEKGADLSSEAALESYIGVFDQPRKFVFDKPFLLFLKEKEAQYPYLALWVDNSDLLVKV